MKLFKQLSINLAILSAMLLTSCLGHQDNDYTTTDKLTGYFNVFYDNEGHQTFKEGVSYEITWHYDDNMKASVNILGLQLPDGAKYSNITLDDLNWKINNMGWQDITGTNCTPANSLSSIVFDKFNFAMLNRVYNGYQFPACSMITYSIDGSEYRVISLPQQTVEVGDTRVVDPKGNVFTQGTAESPFYYFILNPEKKTAFIVIQGAKFAESMPAMNMKFPDMKFEVDEYGNIMIFADKLTPTLLASGVSDINAPGTPFEGATISNFISEYRPASGVDMSFTCTIATKNAPQPQPYNVTFSTKFPSTAK